MISRLSWFALGLAGSLYCGFAAEPEPPPHWVWPRENRQGTDTVQLQTLFFVPPEATRIQLRGLGDFCRWEAFLDGQLLVRQADYSGWLEVDLPPGLVSGYHPLQIRATGSPGPSALALEVVAETAAGAQALSQTGPEWKGTVLDRPGTRNPAAPGPEEAVLSFGRVLSEFWGHPNSAIQVQALDDYTQWKRALDKGQGTDTTAFRIPAGVRLERLRSATPEEGSWISLAFDPAGNLLISREKTGLIQILPGEDGRYAGPSKTVEQSLQEIRGLAYLKDRLFANANRSKGLFELQDANGNGAFERVERLVETQAGGHGRNDVVVGPDGWIYQMHGDSVSVPESARYLPVRPPPLNPGDDLPHGHLIRMHPDTREWEVVSMGLRNPYGVAFNQHGDAFTYDADAEFDMGSPWYRPNHVRLLMPGTDYGWRRVTGKWPPYFLDHADNPPDTLVIGKGSPTSVLFATESRLPAPWREALLILDWAYGRILAVHLTPLGAGYRARAVPFLRGEPANVTDLAIGPDHDLYFITGGRQTQSALYRVSPDPAFPPPVNAGATPQGEARERHAQQARRLRRQLEALYAPDEPAAVPLAWRNLSHPDPWIAYAARTVLEHQPTGTWDGEALRETSLLTALPALHALARMDLPRPPGGAGRWAEILKRLLSFPLETLGEKEKDRFLRIIEICLVREPDASSAIRLRMARKVETLLPSAHETVNRHAVRLLARLQSNHLPELALPLLEGAQDQATEMDYLFALREVKQGWNLERRRVYFTHLNHAALTYQGGAGLPKFLEQIRRDAVAHLTEENRIALGELIGEAPTDFNLPPLPPPRPFVREWKLEDLEPVWATPDRPRDYVRGRELFRAAQCLYCHQLGISGRPVGPDLTGVGRRFGPRDLLDSILNPSKVISETYASVRVTRRDGETFTGRVAAAGDYREPVLRLETNPLPPGETISLPKAEIVRTEPSSVSPMPEGLLNGLTLDEIRDLIAYLEASGDPRHPVFRPE